MDTLTLLIVDTIIGVRGVTRHPASLGKFSHFASLFLELLLWGCGGLICITIIDSHVEYGLVPSSGRGGSLENGKEGISCSLPFVDAAAIADRRGKHSMARVRQCSSIVISF